MFRMPACILALVVAFAHVHPAQAKIALPRGPSVVMVACEDEYDAKTTLPAFAEELKKSNPAFRISMLVGNKEKTDIPGIQAIDGADLLILYMRRTQLPEAQLTRFKSYFASGRPIVAIRTSSHGFQNWLDFDHEVLGAKYDNHHGNKKEGSEISFVADHAKHAVLAGIEAKPFHSPMWIYKYPRMDESCTVLMRGTYDGKTEPVTWVRSRKTDTGPDAAKVAGNGRVFYTAMGVPEDFKNPAFVKLLTNGVQWCLEKAK